jgi:proliferating cell nuclear antigen PCNA
MKFQIQDTKKAQEWIELLKIIKHLSNHITFMCTPTQMFIQVMDMAHVCLMDIKIPSSWFFLYESPNEVFSVSIAILIKLFGMYSSEVIEVFTDSDKIHIHFNQQKMFAIPLMTIDTDTLDTAINDSQVYFVIPTKTFDKYIHELSVFGETIEFICNKDIISLKSENHEGSLHIELKSETLPEFNGCEKMIKGHFCTKYLQYISKLSIYPDIHIYLTEDAPMRITFKSDIVIHYFIAPKFED